METSASPQGVLRTDRRNGGHVIAEYDDSGLLHKYIYGARVDEPVCMIDVADSNAVYYYHFDGLGSVVALSNSNGDSCQSYEYSAYGQVAASDPNFLANPYMFTGRRFDIETGLYYYRARYYNPHIGRFMQTDPIGYGDGINWYAYCGNNPLSYFDPYGLSIIADVCDVCEPCNPYNAGKKEATKQSEVGDAGWITFKVAGSDKKRYTTVNSFKDFENWMNVMYENDFQVTFFEFVGHGVPEGNCLIMGDDMFGTGKSYPKDNWYGIDDWGCLLNYILAPNALIELEACFTAGSIGIGDAFKEHLPDATIWGYTGKSQLWIPSLPIAWETREHVFYPSSEWIQIGGPPALIIDDD